MLIAIAAFRPVRSQVYHAWKMKNMKKEGGAKEDARAPGLAASAEARGAAPRPPAPKKKTERPQRFFRIPFIRPGDAEKSEGGAKKKQSEMTKAERSALQEAQRAAKAAKKTGGDNAAGAGGSEASSASSVPASKGPKPSSLPPPRNPSVSSLVPSSKPSESSHATESRTKLKNSVAMCEVRTTQK